MFLCILIINKNNRLIYTTLSICLWVDFYVLQNSISFHIKYFLFRKSNGLRPCFWRLHQYFICPFFSSKHSYISMHTQNMIIKVHLLKTWKFELSVSGLLDCFICILLSSIDKIKNKKILIWEKIQLKIKQLNFLMCNFYMAHSLLYRTTILDFFCFQLELPVIH